MGQIGADRARLQPLLAQRLQAEAFQPFRQRLAVVAHQQRQMREIRNIEIKRAEKLDLNGGVGHMVLAANHMGNAQLAVIDHRR